MLSVRDVHGQLEKLRDGAINMADFDRWVMSTGWNLEKKAPVGSRVYELVREIQGLLSESQHGEYSDSQLRRRLFAAAEVPQVFKVNFIFRDGPIVTDDEPVSVVPSARLIFGSEQRRLALG